MALEVFGERFTHSERAKMEREEEVCPYCRFPITAGERVVRCPGCDTLHHADCWEENGGCARYGCLHSPEMSGGPALPREGPPPRLTFCHHCGYSPLPEVANFCPRCGARVGLRGPIRAGGTPSGSWVDACCGCLVGLFIIFLLLLILGGGCF